MAQAGDVMQQLPHSASGVSQLPQAALDAKGRSQSQQVRYKGSLRLMLTAHYVTMRATEPEM